MKKLIEIQWQVELPEGYVFRPDAEMAEILKDVWEIYLKGIWEMEISQGCCKNFSLIITTIEQGTAKTQMFTFPDTMK